MKPLFYLPAAGVAALLLTTATGWLAPVAASDYQVETLVAGSPFCGVHGLGIDREDQLYAGSVVGQQIYRVDTDDGSVSTHVGPPQGMADDMEFLADGTLIWTAISQNAVRARKPGGEIVDLASDLVSVNSIAYDGAENRLFVAQVFGGDALWELDPAGEKPRRNILRDMGGLNGFDIGPDGMIYGPLWFKQQLVKINPDSGAMQVVTDGFHTPAAANFDSKWNLYVLDTGTGEVFRVDIKTGEKAVFARLKTSLDNLAIDSQDRIYVSNMADNSIHRIDSDSGEVEEIVAGGLSCSMAVSVASDPDGDTLYLADIFALRAIDGGTGAITDIGRAHAAGTHIGYPSGVRASANRLYVITGQGLQVYDRHSHELLREWRGIRGLQQVRELANGDLLSLSEGGKRLTRLAKDDYNQQDVIAANLESVGDMTLDGADMLYVTQPAANSVSRIDLSSGERKVITRKLNSPRGIDLSPSGKLVIMESGGRILALEPQDPAHIEIIAEKIPVGRFNPEAGTQTPGLAVGADGTIYAVSDKENAIYRFSKQAQ